MLQLQSNPAVEPSFFCLAPQAGALKHVASDRTTWGSEREARSRTSLDRDPCRRRHTDLSMPHLTGAISSTLRHCHWSCNDVLPSSLMASVNTYRLTAAKVLGHLAFLLLFIGHIEETGFPCCYCQGEDPTSVSLKTRVDGPKTCA